MQGGANVIAEVCVAGLPVIVSDIAGNAGLLGQDYPGLFPAGDSAALALLVARFESGLAFRVGLTERCRALGSRHTPEAEQAALLAVIQRA